MKRYLLIIFIPLLIHGSLKEKPSQKSEQKKALHDVKKKKNLFEGRAGYFLFTTKQNREIFDTGSVDLELEYNRWFLSHSTYWVNFNFTWDNGHSILFTTPSTMYISTLSAGARQCFPMFSEKAQFYLGMGLSAAVINTRDNSTFIPKSLARFSPGLVWKSGFLFILSNNLTLNPFFDYYLQPTIRRIDSSFYGKVTDVGGFRTGLGLGYLF